MPGAVQITALVHPQKAFTALVTIDIQCILDIVQPWYYVTHGVTNYLVVYELIVVFTIFFEKQTESFLLGFI